MSEEEIIKEIESLSPSEEAIQGLLELYNKEKEKNKELEADYIDLDKECRENKKIAEITKISCIQLLKNDYISKDKIREKIKELNKVKNKDLEFPILAEEEKKIFITLLQELLEE